MIKAAQTNDPPSPGASWRVQTKINMLSSQPFWLLPCGAQTIPKMVIVFCAQSDLANFSPKNFCKGF